MAYRRTLRPWMSLFLAPLLSLALALPALADREVGARVLAEWPENQCWYAGTVAEVRGADYRIDFADGDNALIGAEKVVDDKVGPGAKVLGNWKGEGTLYPGTIASRDGDKIRINYDDGDVEDTTMAFICLEARNLPR